MRYIYFWSTMPRIHDTLLVCSIHWNHGPRDYFDRSSVIDNEAENLNVVSLLHGANVATG
jgi:hypothetical protein